jgi:hypothetical protein
MEQLPCQEIDITLYQTGEPEPDLKDFQIAGKRIIAYNKCQGPRVGDFVIMPDGRYERFTYDHGDGIQITCGRGSESFYIGEKGYVSYSGGLDPCIPREKIKPTDEKKRGRYWFFHHDYWHAHCGIGLIFDIRVFKVES